MGLDRRCIFCHRQQNRMYALVWLSHIWCTTCATVHPWGRYTQFSSLLQRFDTRPLLREGKSSIILGPSFYVAFSPWSQALRTSLSGTSIDYLIGFPYTGLFTNLLNSTNHSKSATWMLGCHFLSDTLVTCVWRLAFGDGRLATGTGDMRLVTGDGRLCVWRRWLNG